MISLPNEPTLSFFHSLSLPPHHTLRVHALCKAAFHEADSHSVTIHSRLGLSCDALRSPNQRHTIETEERLLRNNFYP